MLDVTFDWYQESKDFGWTAYSRTSGISRSIAPYFVTMPEPTKPLPVEYKSSPDGPWKPGGTISSTESDPEFRVIVGKGGGEGWWRLRYPGDAYYGEEVSPRLGGSTAPPGSPA